MIQREDVLRFYVLGRVQGVGFRRWAVREASALQLTGWIRNRYDGRVEILAKGNDTALKTFIDLCRKGPLFAKVLELDFNVTAQDEPPLTEGAFVKTSDF